MSIFFDIVKDIRDCIGDNAFMAIGSTLLSVPAWVYLKFKNRRSRRFSKINEEIKCSMLNELVELESDGLTFKNKITIKLKLQKIGIYIPWRLGRYVLQYTEEKGIPYDDAKLNDFLISPQQMNINAKSCQWSKAKYQRRMKEIWAVALTCTVVLLGYSIYCINLAQKLQGNNIWAAYSIAAVMFITWALIYIGFIIESGRLMNTKRFFTDFSPWLETKFAEEKEDEINRSPCIPIVEKQ